MQNSPGKPGNLLEFHLSEVLTTLAHYALLHLNMNLVMTCFGNGSLIWLGLKLCGDGDTLNGSHFVVNFTSRVLEIWIWSFTSFENMNLVDKLWKHEFGMTGWPLLYWCTDCTYLYWEQKCTAKCTDKSLFFGDVLLNVLGSLMFIPLINFQSFSSIEGPPLDLT